MEKTNLPKASTASIKTVSLGNNTFVIDSNIDSQPNSNNDKTLKDLKSAIDKGVFSELENLESEKNG